MQVKTMRFVRNAHEALANERLQQALRRTECRFVQGRREALRELDDPDAVRAHAAAIRDRVLAQLDRWLERFEQEATARGAVVHWAEDAAAARRIVCDIARSHGVKKVVKSKSMVSEEVALNEALEAAGIKVVETDLGEYILQLAHEPPSHIVAPVLHKTRDEIADLFACHHGRPRQTGIAELTREAREILRPHFLSADMGISGANFLIAETGSVMIVTNEGNGRLATTLPRVHVAITGIEKVVPTLEDAATLLRLLPRSATGQPITNYVSLLTGTRNTHDHDGPEHFHIVLLDNGRSSLVGGELEPILRCIRCGACMNHCPVYQNVGGHAYGWVYPGPMGSVLTPAYVGLKQTLPLPNASTLCGRCAEVCPVNIPLPDLLRALRRAQVERGLRPFSERLALRLWTGLAQRPWLYRRVTAWAVRLLHALGGKQGRLSSLPFARGFTQGRDVPAPCGRTFHELYRRRSAS
ncbi:LutB/LldF family L-lactate oxidation iron-sulfur protein [Thiobacter aerophilum]|uniref:LutB/LldF family L-lactate oxidation iron-sulfur protein n=1 Tax=Thiobacter aerophilum TaxID=3121275 RepID=A0ABV0EFF5_9BURK